jgi:DNA-binding NarL/FixJ family response regulator
MHSTPTSRPLAQRMVQPNRLGTIRVLLADDSPSFLAAVWSCLHLWPIAKIIDEARDGEEALIKARQSLPDLILLDIGMPKVNGLDVAKTMQSWANPPRIVFLSMNDSEAYRAAAQELGVFGFISKSDFVNELPRILERVAVSLENERKAT